MSTKLIQTKVVIAQGTENIFQQYLIDLTEKVGNQTPDEIFMIESVKSWFELKDAHVTREGSVVIFDGYIHKNIMYKVKKEKGEKGEDETVIGEMKHITIKRPFNGLVEVTPIDKSVCFDPDTDFVELVEAKILGEVDDPIARKHEDDEKTTKINEKMAIRMTFKVVRWEHLKVETDEHHHPHPEPHSFCEE
ncbi:hypothetical protein [Clostridium septicum]|uniref:SipL SPOCS domain-containing protein n=1 Tax=Clostridium septicum TaxID=1504 RepID=A0A9N7PHZ9_CLOSE|nr:hypothetical protein [Clostridium septicum]AYE33240.1 hypothetical protein CP523_01565 [Clostridium septicum]MDU1313028.1 hypothetical protein [Clostridium septicum]QAS61412.1 hypothetical protein EI377_12085 [Clostridium septicum]UEC22156.1 hypothetical protein LK444_07310 [Clostridium septicum]USR99813.1 hypothetical protein NH397_09875 [Clostridium septicum]